MYRDATVLPIAGITALPAVFCAMYSWYEVVSEVRQAQDGRGRPVTAASELLCHITLLVYIA
jgi:hypothetical protein